MEKHIRLSYGADITYIELGEENEKILFMSEFYYLSFMPLVEALAKEFHIFAATMRLDGPITEYEADGEINWAKQWGRDLYELSEILGIEQFYYVGKCHGSIPGWYILENYPKKLIAFAVLSFIPWSRDPAKANVKFFQTQKRSKELGPRAHVANCVRKSENIDKKLTEMATADLDMITTQKYILPFTDFKTDESLFSFYKNIQTPMMITFGLDDAGVDSPIFMDTIRAIPHIKVVLYQGERHFYEMDIPEKLSAEIINFFYQVENCFDS